METINILNKFDNLAYKNFHERDLSSSLKELLSEDRSVIDEELKAEIMAFDFAENYQDQKTGWGTYFGPMMVWNNDDGTATETPSIKLVTPEMIGYWEKRAKESLNPILKARYAGLVCDFKQKILGVNPSHEIDRIYIKALIDTANGDFNKYKVHTFSKLERALTLAIGLNDSNLILESKQALLTFEDKYSIDDKPGLWGYSFDLLIGNKKVDLSEAEERKIITELEDKLNRLTTKDSEEQKIDPWAAEAAAERLAIYYRRKQKMEDVRRVILKVGEAFNEIMGEASAMQASGWLEHLHKLYTNFNLREEAKTTLLRIRELGPQVSSELKPFSHSFELSKKEMDDYISSMTSGELSDIIFRIAVQYIPIKKNAKDQIFDLSKKAPFTFLMSQQIQDEKGRVVATIGSLENDLEGQLVRRISENLSFSALFLRAVMHEAINKKGLSKTDILSFIEKTPIINADRFQIIKIALDAYFQSDFLVFIHLIIPQIEEAIRNIVEYSGGNILKPSKGGGYHLRTFDEILRDEIVKEALGEDFADYFRIVYTDQRGWNLRNSVCHGMAAPNMFNPKTADRILHTLICLGLIHKEEVLWQEEVRPQPHT